MTDDKKRNRILVGVPSGGGFAAEQRDENTDLVADEGESDNSPYAAPQARSGLGEGQGVYRLPSAILEAVDPAGSAGGLDPRHVGKDGDRLVRELDVRLPAGVSVEVDDGSATSDWTDAAFYIIGLSVGRQRECSTVHGGGESPSLSKAATAGFVSQGAPLC